MKWRQAVMDIMGTLMGPAKKVALLPALVFGVVGVLLALGGLIPGVNIITTLITIGLFFLGFLVTIALGYMTAKKVNVKDMKSAAMNGAMGGLFFGLVYGIFGVIAGIITGVGTMLVGGAATAISGDPTGALGGGIGLFASIIGSVIALVFGLIWGLILGAIGGAIKIVLKK